MSENRSEKMLLWLASITLLWAGQTKAAPSPACAENQWPLCDYVFREDGYYDYYLHNEVYQEEMGVTTYFLNMTSQKWFDESWTDWPVWWHIVVINVPDDLQHDEHALIYVGGRSNDDSGWPGLGTDQVNKTAHIASSGHFVTGVVYHIPNQPIIFTNDSRQQKRKEDDIIAWTWREYADAWEADLDTADLDTADPEVLLRMPMCKGVVKTMDTIETFVNEDLGVGNIDKFMLTGESKRGWTTWMTAPIDDRVIAMAPVVLSSLNMHPSFHHYYQSYGGWPLYFWDYWSKGLMGRIDDPGMFALYEIDDPYVYRSGMTMPILIISAASDEFFLIDDTHYFMDDLPGDTYWWALEDTGHWMSRSPRNQDYWGMLETFLLTEIVQDYERPDTSWSWDAPEEREGSGSITLHSVQTPLEIMAFSAPSVVEDRRDWRLRVRCDISDLCGEKDTNITWTKTDVQFLGAGEYRIEYEVPEEGFLAFYMQMRYAGPNGRDFWFSTEAAIIPDYFPYPDCSGNCTGILK